MPDEPDLDTDDKKKQERWIKIGALATIGVLVLYFMTRKSSGSSSSGTSTATAVPTNPYAYTGTVPTGAGGGNGLSSSLTGLSNQIAELQYEVMGATAGGVGSPVSAAPAATVTTPAATAVPSASPGYGSEGVNGQTFDILGIETGSGPQGFSGYNVSGGAPVYYLAPGSTTPSQGSSQAVPGAQVLVPSIYGANISSTPNHPYQG